MIPAKAFVAQESGQTLNSAKNLIGEDKGRIEIAYRAIEKYPLAR